jgi:hypothetical protein
MRWQLSPSKHLQKYLNTPDEKVSSTRKISKEISERGEAAGLRGSGRNLFAFCC